MSSTTDTAKRATVSTACKLPRTKHHIVVGGTIRTLLRGTTAKHFLKPDLSGIPLNTPAAPVGSVEALQAVGVLFSNAKESLDECVRTGLLATACAGIEVNLGSGEENTCCDERGELECCKCSHPLCLQCMPDNELKNVVEHGCCGDPDHDHDIYCPSAECRDCADPWYQRSSLADALIENQAIITTGRILEGEFQTADGVEVDEGDSGLALGLALFSRDWISEEMEDKCEALVGAFYPSDTTN